MTFLHLLKTSALAAVAALGLAVTADARSIEDIKKDGKIVVATEGQFAPFNYFQGTKLTGFEVEVAEAMAAVTRSSQWRLADLSQLDPDSRYYVEFSWRLDSSQLPSPMQIGLTVQADWSLGIERVLRLD